MERFSFLFHVLPVYPTHVKGGLRNILSHEVGSDGGFGAIEPPVVREKDTLHSPLVFLVFSPLERERETGPSMVRANVASPLSLLSLVFPLLTRCLGQLQFSLILLHLPSILFILPHLLLFPSVLFQFSSRK